MKKFLITLCLMLLLAGSAWALPDFMTPVTKAADGQVKATPGIVYGVIVSYAGVTAGDKIEIKNSTDTSGTAQITIVATAANGTVVYTPPVGVYFATAIYYDETKSGGTFTSQVQYF